MILLLACADEPVVEPPPRADPLVSTPLDAPRLARRMAVDLRGSLPTTEELDAIEADPTLVDGFRDDLIADPRLEERLVSFFAERWLTRLDEFELVIHDFHLPNDQEYTFERSIADEPLRLMARIAVDERPWTEIVTTDTTMANEMLGSIFPVDYPEGGNGWLEVHYTDNRPAAGVLHTNGLWWRYITNDSNMNRGRAAALVRLLLCQDILSRPVSLQGSVNLSSEGGLEETIRSTPACVACHATLEPIAASLFGFWTTISYNVTELTMYHPEREPLGPLLLQAEPAWFGTPIGGLVDVGAMVASDPRFPACTAQSAAESLWRRPADPVQDYKTLESLRLTLLEEDWNYLELLRAVTDTPEYRAGASEDVRVRTRRLLTPDQLDTILVDLTGYQWTWLGFNQLGNGDPGFRMMFGGVDGYFLTSPQQDPGLTWAMATERLAEAAAAWGVRKDLENPETARLLTEVDGTELPGDPAFEAALDRMVWRTTAVRADEVRRAELGELWSAVSETEGSRAGWTAVVTALLRDPDFLAY